jgi:hypothetical protein
LILNYFMTISELGRGSVWRSRPAIKSGTKQGSTKLTLGMQRRLPMGKFLLGVATAALWFALSHAANAAQVCKQVCDNGACVDVQVPGVGVQIGR